jgi:polysaccharide export outer membrane protein
VFLDPGGIRVLSAIARAGGPRNPAYETIVTIQRGGRTTQSSLSAIIRNPSQNVALMPGDVVFVSREQKIFLALGPPRRRARSGARRTAASASTTTM